MDEEVLRDAGHDARGVGGVAHRLDVHRLIDDSHQRPDGRVEPFEQAAHERDIATARDRNEVAHVVHAVGERLLHERRPLRFEGAEPPLEMGRRGCRDDHRLAVVEVVEVGHPTRPEAFGERGAGLGVGIHDARELGVL